MILSCVSVCKGALILANIDNLFVLVMYNILVIKISSSWNTIVASFFSVMPIHVFSTLFTIMYLQNYAGKVKDTEN